MTIEHDQVRQAIERYNKEVAADIKLKRAEELQADATLAEAKEELLALAFGADITQEELGGLLKRGDLGAEVLRVMTQGEAATIEEAITLLYQRAGDEAGERYVDPLTAAFGKRVYTFGPDPLGVISNEQYNAEHPRRKRKPKTRADVKRGVDAWRAMNEIRAEFDQSIDASMRGGDEK